MVNVKYFVHHLLLNVLYENRLKLFDKQMKKIFRQIVQLIPKGKHSIFLFKKKTKKILLIDNFQGMLQQ